MHVCIYRDDRDIASERPGIYVAVFLFYAFKSMRVQTPQISFLYYNTSMNLGCIGQAFTINTENTGANQEMLDSYFDVSAVECEAWCAPGGSNCTRLCPPKFTRCNQLNKSVRIFTCVYS